jgi:hypothetical protein
MTVIEIKPNVGAGKVSKLRASCQRENLVRGRIDWHETVGVLRIAAVRIMRQDWVGIHRA